MKLKDLRRKLTWPISYCVLIGIKALASLIRFKSLSTFASLFSKILLWLPGNRKLIMANLDVVFPDLTDEERQALCRKSARSIVLTFLEFLWIRGNPKKLTSIVRIEPKSEALLKSYYEKDQGQEKEKSGSEKLPEPRTVQGVDAVQVVLTALVKNKTGLYPANDQSHGCPGPYISWRNGPGLHEKIPCLGNEGNTPNIPGQGRHTMVVQDLNPFLQLACMLRRGLGPERQKAGREECALGVVANAEPSRIHTVVGRQAFKHLLRDAAAGPVGQRTVLVAHQRTTIVAPLRIPIGA